MPREPVAFESCSLDSEGGDSRAACAKVEVPLDWNDPSGTKLSLFVKRVSGTGPEPHRQIWLLSGGPGSAGSGFDDYAAELVVRDPQADVYIPDHRGTGRSGRLACQAIALVKSCVREVETNWGKGALAHFNVTNAAKDVGHVVARTRATGQLVHVYGGSYGTMWAQRYLQLFPKQPTSVTLDGICQSGMCSFATMPYWHDTIGKKLLRECAADRVCGAKLGPDPIARTREAFAKLPTCGGMTGFGAEALRYYFSWFLQSFTLRPLIPALVYRVLRCDAGDIAALQHFREMLATTDYSEYDFELKSAVPLASDVLKYNIAISELEPRPAITEEEVARLAEGSLFGFFDDDYEELRAQWPKYPLDEWAGKYPETDVPVLLMNGTLDTQTPQATADAVAPHYTKPHQTYVVVPRAPHGVLWRSPMVGTEETCGERMWQAFVAAPASPVDTSCIAQIRGHEFDREPSPVAQYFFGQRSLWENAPGVPPLGPGRARRLPAEDVVRLRRSLRRFATERAALAR